MVTAFPGRLPTVAKGFLFIAQSRPDNASFLHQWGGVGVLVRDDIPHALVPGVSAPDLLVLDLTCCFLVGAYLPPVGSHWDTWTAVDPELRLQEALAYCTASRLQKVLVLGDLNARTGSGDSQSLHSLSGPPSSTRSSADVVTNSWGRRLLHWCSVFQLSILNGTSAERNSPGAFTCFQAQGASVVDYVLASADIAPWIADRALVVESSPWSDHCQVTVTLTLPFDVLGPEWVVALRHKDLVLPPCQSIFTPLDVLAHDAVQGADHDDWISRR
jgi:exonuclease III